MTRSFIRGDVLRTLSDAQQLAALRLNLLSMIQLAGSGHPGSSLSALSILWELRSERCPKDVVCSSKGHDVPAFYVLQHLDGHLRDDDLLTFRRPNGLPGHPERGVHGHLLSTGSLGMGLSKAIGLARAWPHRRVICLIGDGEWQEGQCAEAAHHLLRYPLPNLRVIMDANGYQSDTATLQGLPVPACIEVWPTLKGAGVLEPGGEERYPYHSGALPEDLYQSCCRQLVASMRDVPVWSVGAVAPSRPSEPTFATAYGRALLTVMAAHPRVVVLDADLAWDCGLSEVRARYPDRFIECGIAEQHMVSLASGLAAGGFQPIVHTFTSFFGRAHEQIRDVLTDTHIAVVFTGFLAGSGPIGPGRSHDVGDLDLLSFTQGRCTVMEPTLDTIAADLAAAVRTDQSVYLRCRSRRH